jgi:hypothetical protein
MNWRRKTWYWVSLVATTVVVVAALVVLGGPDGRGAEHSSLHAATLPIFRMDADHATYADLGAIGSASDVIVIGKVLSQKTEPGVSPGTDALGDPLPAIPHTNSSVHVDTVLKGGGSSGETIVVSLSGGTTPKGTFVLDGAPEIHVGDVDLFFLAAGSNGIYYPLAGGAAVAPQQSNGSFLLDPDATGGTSLGFTESALRAALATPAAGSPTAAHRAPPLRLHLRLAAHQRLSRILSHGLKLRIACSEECTLTGRLALKRGLAKALGFDHTPRTVVVARGSRQGGGTLVLKFTHTAIRQLRGQKSVTLSLIVSAHGVSGPSVILRRAVHLTRAAKRAQHGR